MSPSGTPSVTRVLVVLAAALILPGCGDDGADSVPATAVPGTSVVFDLDADLSDPQRFYDLPYPLDLRLDAAGRPQLLGLPLPERFTLLLRLRSLVEQRRGFPTTAVGYFRFSGPLRQRHPTVRIPARADAPVLLVDVDPASPERGRLFPTVAVTLAADAYVPENVLAVGAMPGIVLRPRRQYAYVILRSLADAAAAPLGIPLPLQQLRRGETPNGTRGPDARMLYAPLWDALQVAGVDLNEVAAATVFSTGDVVGELEELSSRLVERHQTAIEGLRLDPTDGADHPRFCELHGTMRLPQFQLGQPPYNSEGSFEIGEHGLPIVQRHEDVAVVLTLPRLPMPPDGYPLLLYLHGSGGVAAQVVDRGPVTEPGGQPAKGLGPAHVVAEHGFATAASALPVNPERLPGAEPRAYLNLRNLAAYPFTFAQGTIEQRLLINALERLQIDPEVFAECDGVSLPAGAMRFRLRTAPLYLIGQSLGAQYVNMVGAVEPRVAGVVPTGSGGLWSLVVLEVDDTSSLIGLLLRTDAPLTYLHPGLQLVQTAFEPAEPLVYAARLAVDPLPGHPVRSIYQPVGLNDPGFPNPIYDAMATASGTQQAGEVLWPELQDSLAAAGRGGRLPYPVHSNARSLRDDAYTGVVVQYAGDGILDAHHIFAQLDAVKYQYGCFLAALAETGIATVPAPLPLGTPCPRPTDP